jgi:hypothetical protein
MSDGAMDAGVIAQFDEICALHLGAPREWRGNFL